MITYNPMGTDPTPTNLPAGTTLHWIQVVDTNTPGAAGARGVAGTGANGNPPARVPTSTIPTGLIRITGTSRPAFATANGSGFLDRVSKNLVAGTVWKSKRFLRPRWTRRRSSTGKR